MSIRRKYFELSVAGKFPVLLFSTTVRFSDVFRGERKRCIGNKWVKLILDFDWIFSTVHTYIFILNSSVTRAF